LRSRAAGAGGRRAIPIHQIVWGCLYGTLLFGAPIETHTLVGAAIIVGSGWLILR
jgi:S-adenosylmethionine uptake transporter